MRNVAFHNARKDAIDEYCRVKNGKLIDRYLGPDILGLSKKATCLRVRVAEINFGRCLPMSTTLAAAARSKPS